MTAVWRVLVAGLVIAGGLLPAAAWAHEERPAEFPDGSGSVPEYREPIADPHLVVCKEESAGLIADIADAELRAMNETLLAECDFEHIQAAVDAVAERATTIYLLPGTYREEPTRPEPACGEGYDEGIVSYEQQLACPSAINLVSILGDGDDADFRCDGRLCDLQIEGTGDDRMDVLIDGGYNADGDWVKHNGIRADRADGIYLTNFSIQRFRENAIYILETDGFVIENITARWNDLYGFLTFADDHGVYRDCEAYTNGDGGVYPGSASDVNGDNAETGPLDRYAIEIHDCVSHHNALGYSGTAGNSVYVHDNVFHSNQAGIVTDSIYPDHPGLPQDHQWLENNVIYGNNINYTEMYVQSGICDLPPAERGYEEGTVCPNVPAPVGTGAVIAGGNHNFAQGNHVYDNWRAGFMLIWVPAAIRNENDPLKQTDTSHFNHYVDNRMGSTEGGAFLPNGLDFWWDDQGEGNCWEGNVSDTADDGAATDNATDPRGLPDCDSGGSVFLVSNPVKTTSIAACATYDRNDPDFRDPPNCDFFNTPPEPEGRREAAGQGSPTPTTSASATSSPTASSSPSASVAPTATSPTTASPAGGGLPATGGPALLVLAGLGAVGLALRLRARR